MVENSPVAILYQVAAPPPVNGMIKPFKPGGSRDSGADIAAALVRCGYPVVLPAPNPDSRCETDWLL